MDSSVWFAIGIFAGYLIGHAVAEAENRHRDRRIDKAVEQRLKAEDEFKKLGIHRVK
jgi:hypothetical protein